MLELAHSVFNAVTGVAEAQEEAPPLPTPAITYTLCKLLSLES